MSEDGYYSEDKDGNLIHHEYKKPTFWQRAKHFATYGHEMNLETNVTSYICFPPTLGKVFFESMVGDAVSIAKALNTKRSFGTGYDYSLHGDEVEFETPNTFFTLEFSPDGGYATVSGKRKANNQRISPEQYTYLDWDML